MIYSSYNFLIRKVSFDKTNDSESAILTLIIPGTFEGTIPERLPWDE
jgi:hypothetical protein